MGVISQVDDPGRWSAGMVAQEKQWCQNLCQQRFISCMKGMKR